MAISRKAWLFGAGGAVAAGAGAFSIPGGGPRTYFGGQPPATDFAPRGSTFDAPELRAELAWLVEAMREVGANPFAYTSEGAFDAAYRDALARLNRPLGSRGFFLVAAPLFATLRDGHVNIQVGRDYELWRKRGGRAFPLVLKFTEYGAFVEVPTHPALPAGTRIEVVDGVTSRDVISAVSQLQGAQTPLLRLMFAADQIRQYYFARCGERPAFAIRATRPNGEKVRVLAPATTVRQLDEAFDTNSAVKDTNYTFTRIAGGRVGYIDYRHCRDFSAFKTFAQQTFESIATHPVKGLIVDIRRNGGGDSNLNPELWSYVAAKPIRQNAVWIEKVSSRLKREYGFFTYARKYLPPAWLMRDGSVWSVDVSRFAGVAPKAESIRYRGPVYLLIGVSTFSSAQDCAEIAKDNALATLVGQETGEPEDSTGEVYQGYSPRIGTAFQFTTKYFWDPKHPRGRGVIPDVTIVPTEADLRANRDPVLDYAVRRITQA